MTKRKKYIKFILIHVLIAIILVTVSSVLYRTGNSLGNKYHEHTWAVRRLINIELLLDIVVHPFDMLVNIKFGGKEFNTPWTYELRRFLTIPLSTFTYLLIWIGISQIVHKSK